MRLRVVFLKFVAAVSFFLVALSGASADDVISFPPGGAGESGISEAQVSEVLGHVQALESERYSQAGRQFLAISDWQKPWVAAYAERHDALDTITVWGGLARAPGMTLGAIAFVACHELGHHRGGAPMQTIPFAEWASSEGEADYFAGGCVDAYLSRFGESGFTKPRAEALQACMGEVRCATVTQAAWELFNVMGSLGTEPVTISPITPDSSIAAETVINSYPSYQCRLDTTQAGASGRPRPACWFRASFQLQDRAAHLIF